jgi:hypothetical protein
MLLAVPVVAALGCSDDGSNFGAVDERAWDEVGIVVAAELGPEFEPADGSFSRGGGYLTPGEAILTLQGGGELEIPAGTPGGNMCAELMSEADRVAASGFPPPRGTTPEAVHVSLSGTGQCIVIAELEQGRTVRRFEILPSDGRGLAEVGGLVSRGDGGYLTSSGYRFAAAEHAEVVCDIDPPQRISDFVDEEIWNTAFLDPATDTIVKVVCIYDG